VTEPGCYRVPLDRYPGMNPFVLDWLKGDQRFLPRLTENDARAAGGGGAPPKAFVNALIESNRRWGLDVADEVRRWAAGGTMTLVAGQQVGFAGGPLFTLSKFASLLKIKRQNEERGIPTTVFFWLATEDHDFNEVAQIALPARDPQRQVDLVYLRATRPPDSRQVVGRKPIPDALAEQLLSYLGISRPRWLRQGITFGDSFAELFASIVDEKFVFVDALLPELRRAGAPLFDRILERWNDVQREIASKSDALKAAGYTPQIAARPGEPYTLLFELHDDGQREILQKPARVSPERLSTSALTRPLLQDFVLRPDVFFGGPAEVSYYAQITGLHALLDVPMPRVALRGHVLVAPRRILRSIARYDLQPSALFTTPDQLLAAGEPRGVAEVRSIAEEAERQLKEKIEMIRALALPADHAVARSINRSIGHIEYHFRKLTERAIRGLVRKDKERYQAVRELIATLYPDRHVQDRVVAWFGYWCEYEKPFVKRVIDEVEPDASTFKIVSL
jgi:bacillithiol synthase